MTNAAFDALYPKYADVIKGIARKLSGGNERLLDDLEQLGMIALWKCEPENATKNPDSYIRQAIKFRMIDFLRKEAPRRYESLDEILEGHTVQIIHSPTGQHEIVNGSGPYRERVERAYIRVDIGENEEGYRT
jgi:RNA polymerase sigma factor (sigma-70 family)